MEFEKHVEEIRCGTFHMNDEEAKSIIDGYLEKHPELLLIQERDWFYKYC